MTLFSQNLDVSGSVKSWELQGASGAPLTKQFTCVTCRLQEPRIVPANMLEPLQEVEYVKSEDKLARIGEALQKTAPPVLIFAEHTRDVDMVHEYLLTKGVDAVAIHGMFRSGFVKNIPLDLQSPVPSTVTWLKTCL
jgi:hypothetical protein